MAALLIGWGLAGCTDSPESAARKEAARAVDQAGRLLRASHQQLVNGSVPGAGVETDLAAVVEEVTPALDNMAPDDDASLRQVAGRIQEAEQSLRAQYAAMQASAAAKNRQRIDQAKALLSDTVRQGAGDPEVVLAPQMMLGTLYLMVARDYRHELRLADIAIQAQQVALGQLASEVTLTRAYSGPLPNYYPYQDAMLRLQNRLEGDPALTGEPESLQSQSQKVSDKINALTAKKKQIAARLESHRGQAKEIDKQYMALLARADKAKGEQQYDIKRQAYQLRTGGQGNSEGGIYHEEQSQLLEYQLATVEQELGLEQFTHGRLTASIQQVNDSVAALAASPIIGNIQRSIEGSNAYEAVQVSRISAQLEALATMEAGYESLRVEAVGAYSDAKQAFSSAARQAGSQERASREHAQAMVAAIDLELADPQYDPAAPESALEHAPGLWQEDAQHYASHLEALALLADIEGVEQEVTGLLQTYDGRAQQARQTIAELVEQGE